MNIASVMSKSGPDPEDGASEHIGGYACASSARGGSGASRARRIAGCVTGRGFACCRVGGLWPKPGRPVWSVLARLAASAALWGFNSVCGSTRWQGHLGRFTGAAAVVRRLVSGSGRLSLCFPDDEASCCGCRGPALACGPVPAHRSRRFRRSHTWTGRAGWCCRLFSPAECGPGRPLSC